MWCRVPKRSSPRLDEVAGRTHLMRIAAGRDWKWPDEYVATVLGTVGSLYDELDATRRDMVRLAVEEATMTKREICRQVGITRRTLDHWIARWEQEPDR
ncbi:helix-turn-helix domain-containing protein [Nakamurella silvestris]|nr:helix-turn-helix domain-containing protein [Nakamurella silvestris]